MRTFARCLGIVMMANGAFDFAFPDAAINFWIKGPGARSKGWITRTAREYSRLSHGSRRLISGWEFLTGAMITWLASPPCAVEAPRLAREPQQAA